MKNKTLKKKRMFPATRPSPTHKETKYSSCSSRVRESLIAVELFYKNVEADNVKISEHAKNCSSGSD